MKQLSQWILYRAQNKSGFCDVSLDHTLALRGDEVIKLCIVLIIDLGANQVGMLAQTPSNKKKEREIHI